MIGHTPEKKSGREPPRKLTLYQGLIGMGMSGVKGSK